MLPLNTFTFEKKKNLNEINYIQKADDKQRWTQHLFIFKKINYLDFPLTIPSPPSDDSSLSRDSSKGVYSMKTELPTWRARSIRTFLDMCWGFCAKGSARAVFWIREVRFARVAGVCIESLAPLSPRFSPSSVANITLFVLFCFVLIVGWMSHIVVF